MKRPLTLRQKSLVIAAALLAGGLLYGFYTAPEEGCSFPKPLTTMDGGTTDLSDRAIVAGDDFLPSGAGGFPTGWTNYRSKRMEIDADFTSGLPLVVIDTGGQEPKRNSIFDHDKGYYVPLDIDPYAYGSIQVLDSGGINRLTDRPTQESPVKLRLRGNSSSNYDKHQYLLRLTDESGHSSRHNFLNMGTSSEWILNVSFIDKSLLRNYLAYTAAGEIMPYTPDARFCEVIWKEDGAFFYEGVYLLMESIEVTKSRIDLPQFSENIANLPFLIRRDRYNLTGVILDNFGTKQELLSGYLDIKWPKATALSQQSIARITEQIDTFEQALFADNYQDFLKYRDCIDVNSFADYFILNEFFLNYDAGFNSTYCYSDYSGRITMGPVWDFDQAMDNNETQIAKLDTTAFHDAPWFRQLLRDPEFTRLIVERYRELRKSILSDESIQTFIDQTVQGLGSAVDRDWARWGYYYIGGGYPIEEYPGQPYRSSRTHAEEVEKLKTILSQHGAWMDEHLDSLYQFSDPNAPEISLEPKEEHSWGSLWAVIFVTAFFISVTLIQRLERGD